MRRTAKTITDLLLGALLVLLICLTLPGLFGVQCYAVVSGSMEPVLPVGSAVYVQKKAPDTIIEGEIITFLTNQSKNRVTHRVIKSDLRRKVFVTKGDANRQKDASLVSWENVCGVEIGCVPYAGYVLEFLNNWKGKAAAVCFFLVLLLISEALTVRREVLQKE